MVHDCKIWAYYGNGHGKSAAAIGDAISLASDENSVVLIQFLKPQYSESYVKRFEPEFKIFRTARNEKCFSELDKQEKEEEIENIRNGISLARKFLVTDGCQILVLDEVLGIIDEGIITEDNLIELLKEKQEEQTVIMTGTIITDRISQICDHIVNVIKEK